MTDFDAVVVAGGRGTRLGGVDKPTIRIGGSTLLERAVAAVRSARTTVVVGPPRDPVSTDAVQVREEPPASGPAAAIDAGLSRLDEASDPAPLIVVLAADLPAAVPAVRALLASVHPVPTPTVDGWIGTDPDGRRQYLLAAYRTDALRAACRSLTAARGSLAGASVRQLLDPLRLVEVPLHPTLTVDVDTPADLVSAIDREAHSDAPPSRA